MKDNLFSKLKVNLLFFIFIYFILFFNFTILYWFCHISKWIHHRYTCVPHPEPSPLLFPHTIPLGHPSAPAPSIQYCASNLDWRLISYMILYMFNAILSNHPTLSLYDVNFVLSLIIVNICMCLSSPSPSASSLTTLCWST